MLPNEIIHYKKTEELEPYRVIVVDASDIVQKGAVRKTWHLHYGVDLFSLTCNQFQLTEQSTGESLKNFFIKKRPYYSGSCLWNHHKHRALSEKWRGFHYQDKNKPFNLYDEILLSNWLKSLDSKTGESSVYVKSGDKEFIPLRICARKKTEEEIAIEEKRLKRLESKKQTTYSEDTKFTHQFMFAITLLPASVSAEKVLEFYRLRWQVEFVFKKYMSILQKVGNLIFAEKWHIMYID